MLTNIKRVLGLKKVDVENVCMLVNMYDMDFREDMVFGRVMNDILNTYRINNVFSTFLHPKDLTDFKVIVELGDLVSTEDMWYFKAVVEKTFKDQEVMEVIKEKFRIKEIELKEILINNSDLLLDVHCKLLSKRFDIILDQENKSADTPVEIVFNSITSKIGLAKYLDKKNEKEVDYSIDMVYFKGYNSIELEVSEYKKSLEYIKDIFESEGFQMYDFKSIKIDDIKTVDDKLHFNVRYTLKNIIGEYPKEFITRNIGKNK